MGGGLGRMWRSAGLITGGLIVKLIPNIINAGPDFEPRSNPLHVWSLV